jgi:hypothetical protein
MKKTTGVKDLLEYANKQLARTDEFATREFKSGISVMIERVLYDTGNYSGFRFLNPGDDSSLTNCDGSEFYNREYYTSRKLS